MRIMLVLLAVLCAGAVSAQATFNVGGTVAANTQDFLVVDIDFATSATPLAVTLSISGNSGTDGLDVFLGDLDAMAATGFTGTVDQGSDAGTGTINLSVTSASYTGVHQFAISINSDSGGGPVTYSGTLTVAALSSGAITQAETNSWSPNGLTEVNRLFSRAIQANWGVDSTGTPQPMEFLVDFGSVAQSITFAVTGDGNITGDLEVLEVLADGSTSSLGTLSGTSSWNDDGTFTTSSRSGVVRIRVLADTANMNFDWTAILPSTASVQAYTQISLSGSIPADGFAYTLIGIDFGTTSNSVMVQFKQFDETGSGNISPVLFLDLDTLATTGTGGFAAQEVNFLSGSGYQEFLLGLGEGASASVNYNVVVEVSVASGNVTNLGTQTLGSTIPFQSLFDRGVVGAESTAAGTYTREFNVDFGGTAHTANLYASLYGGSTTSGELFELDSVGSPTSLGTLSSGSPAFNATSSSRSGVVTFRLVIAATAADDFNYSVIFDDSVSVVSFGQGGGGGGGGDSGCSTGTEQGWTLLLLAAMCAMAVAVRTRRTVP